MVAAPSQIAGAFGWSISKISGYIISFYGKAWQSAFPILDMNTAGSVFPSCAVRFGREFREFTERNTAAHYRVHLAEPAKVGRTEADVAAGYEIKNLFEVIDSEAYRGKTIVLSDNGWQVLSPESLAAQLDDRAERDLRFSGKLSTEEPQE